MSIEHGKHFQGMHPERIHMIKDALQRVDRLTESDYLNGLCDLDDGKRQFPEKYSVLAAALNLTMRRMIEIARAEAAQMRANKLREFLNSRDAYRALAVFRGARSKGSGHLEVEYRQTRFTMGHHLVTALDSYMKAPMNPRITRAETSIDEETGELVTRVTFEDRK